VFIIIVSIPLLTAGIIGHKNGGFPQRNAFFESMQLNNGLGLACNGNTTINARCASSEQPSIAVLGNSYAMVYVKPLLTLGTNSLVQLTQDSCSLGYVQQSIIDVNSMPCREFYQKSVDTIRNTPSINHVLISSPFGKELSSKADAESFSQLLMDLAPRRVVILGPTPSAQLMSENVFLRRRYYGLAMIWIAIFLPQKLMKIKLMSCLNI